jgi:hypothetical protein
MAQKQVRDSEDGVVRELKRVAEEHPETKELTVEFKRDWAYGNAGLENESITRDQVNKTIKK